MNIDLTSLEYQQYKQATIERLTEQIRFFRRIAPEDTPQGGIVNQLKAIDGFLLSFKVWQQIAKVGEPTSRL